VEHQPQRLPPGFYHGAAGSQEPSIVGDNAFPFGDRMLTVAQVAEFLGHHERQVERMAKRGDFPGAYRTGKVRGNWRIPHSGVKAWVEARQLDTERARPRPAGKPRKSSAKATG
jgi:excisionase family DNA binding protein